MIDALPLLLGDDGYQISRSVRLRSAAAAYLVRTPASASNRQKYTWSSWVKRGAMTGGPQLFTAGPDVNNRTCITILSSNTFELYSVTGGTVNMRYTTTAFLRDPTAWYHIVVAVDTTQATAANRIKLYVNGVEWALTAVTTVAQNTNLWVNSANPHRIGCESYTNTNLFDGYFTEQRLIDGQQLLPTAFAEIDSATGVWTAKRYTGTYGTNGFYLDFSDNSAATATALGKDSSGNGNNWTPTSISLTAGATYDSMLDVPTLWADGGNGRGNYCVLNPLKNNASVTGGNLNIAGPSTGGNYTAFATHSTVSTPIYYECIVSNYNTGTIGYVGFGKSEVALVAIIATVTGTFGVRPSNGTWVAYKDATTTNLTGISGLTTGDVVQVAFNPSTGNAWFGKNNTWYNSGNPENGTNPTLTGLTTNVDWNPIVNIYRDGANFIEFAANFGQRPFAYTPPSGFKALNTQNLPTPTILKGNQYFDATLWTGGQTSPFNVVNAGGFQPDVVWAKQRSAAAGHRLYDSSRGAGIRLSTDSTQAEATEANPGVSAFNSNGFTITNPSGAAPFLNETSGTYVGWQWKKGATQGFDIVTYTGDGTTNRTVAHSLGVQPSMFIIKSRSAGTTDWIVHHKDLGNNGGSPAYLQYLVLNTTAAKAASTTLLPVAGLSSTTFPTSGATNNTNVNGNGTTYVAYLFAEVAGFSKFGSYTGNGNADGPFVYCGFRPRFVMVKRTDTTGDWIILDAGRNDYNLTNLFLLANSNTTEGVGTSVNVVDDFVSNGFKLRGTAANGNASGGAYIFAAFAENPFKYSLAR